MPKQPAFPGLRDATKKKQTRALPGGDGGGGALGTSVVADRAALSQVGAEGWSSADAAGDNAAGLFLAELVCAQRPDGRGDAV